MYKTRFRRHPKPSLRFIVCTIQKPALCTYYLTQQRQEQQISCTWKGKGGGVDGAPHRQ